MTKFMQDHLILKADCRRAGSPSQGGRGVPFTKAARQANERFRGLNINGTAARNIAFSPANTGGNYSVMSEVEHIIFNGGNIVFAWGLRRNSYNSIVINAHGAGVHLSELPSDADMALPTDERLARARIALCLNSSSGGGSASSSGKSVQNDVMKAEMESLHVHRSRVQPFDDVRGRERAQIAAA